MLISVWRPLCRSSLDCNMATTWGLQWHRDKLNIAYDEHHWVVGNKYTSKVSVSKNIIGTNCSDKIIRYYKFDLLPRLLVTHCK